MTMQECVSAFDISLFPLYPLFNIPSFTSSDIGLSIIAYLML